MCKNNVYILHMRRKQMKNNQSIRNAFRTIVRSLVKDIKQMKSKIIVTADNSKTLLIPELNETYHSTKGAITEAQHVFIKEGLLFIRPKSHARIFEMGFGTGLNALITDLQKRLSKKK